MRKFTVLIKFQVIAATGMIALSAMFALPTLSQEVDSTEKSAPLKVIEAESNQAESNQEEQAKKSLTTKNSQLSIDQLELLIMPFTKDQIAVEVDAWFDLLREKAQEISNTEISIQTLEESGHVKSNTDIEKEKLVIVSTKLKTEQSNIINRLETVLDAFDDKGGNSTPFRQYINAVGEINLNFRDVEEINLRFTTWLKSPEGGIYLGIKILKFSSILVTAVLISTRVGKLFDSALYRIKSISNLLRGFAIIIVKRSVLFAGGLLALASIGVNLGPILAIAGGISFILGFALQDNLGNVASGLMLLITRPFDIGDEVKLGGYWAYVDSISIASTKLKDFGGNVVTLPNNIVWGGDIINYTHADIRNVKLGVNIKFNQDVDEINKIWLDLATSHPKVIESPEPRISLWNDTYDYHIRVGLSAWSQTHDYWAVYVDLLKGLQKRLQDQNIELAVPTQEIKLNQSSELIQGKSILN